MIPSFARKEMLSALWIKQALPANTLSASGTINTYGASPMPAGSVDMWDAGKLDFRNLLIVCDVASLTGSGTLTLTLRDSGSALTSANGDANSSLAYTCSAISAAGLYTAEIRLSHIYPATSARVIASATADQLRRYISLRAVAAGCDFVFSALFIMGNNLGGFPVQDATALTLTENDA